MKKMILASVLATAVAMPALANETHTPAATPAANAPAPAAASPAAGTAATKVELKDGSWAQIMGTAVTVSKDGGKTWMPAPDGTWEAKDGSKITTKGGIEVK